MKVPRLANLLRPNRVYRGIAVFFLLFTFADLACPGLCRDEFDELSLSAQTQSLADTTMTVNAGEAGEPEQHSQGGSLEEDCFCCCPHLLPVYMPSSADVAAILHQYPPRLNSLPTAPPNCTDHPPRTTAC